MTTNNQNNQQQQKGAVLTNEHDVKIAEINAKKEENISQMSNEKEVKLAEIKVKQAEFEAKLAKDREEDRIQLEKFLKDRQAERDEKVKKFEAVTKAVTGITQAAGLFVTLGLLSKVTDNNNDVY